MQDHHHRARLRASLPHAFVALVLALSGAPVSADGAAPAAPYGRATESTDRAPSPAPLALDGDARWPEPLRLHPPPAGLSPRSALGGGWRHDFEIMLSADGTRRVVHEPDGGRHVFEPPAASTPTRPRRYRARGRGAGSLEAESPARHLWRREDGGRVRFHGSLPIAIETADGRSHALGYRGGRLASVRDTRRGTSLRFVEYGDRRLAIGLPDGEWLHLEGASSGRAPRLRRDRLAPPAAHAPLASAAQEDCPPPPPEGGRCDTTAAPPSADFREAARIDGALRLDLRPASCRSYFVDYEGTERGSVIESALVALAHYAGYERTVRSFPIVDFVGAEWRVVRSRDLADPSYRAPGSLHRRLLRDAAEIETLLLEPLARDGRVDLSELGRTTVLDARERRPLVLELVVRHALASPAQAREIARARRALRERHGIALRVIEIP